MRTKILLLIFISFGVACSSTKNTVDGSEEVVQNDSLPYAIAPVIAQSIITGEISKVDTFFPSIQIARFLAGGKGRALTDEEIYDQMIVPLKERYASNLEVIQLDISRLEINPSDLKYTKFEYFESSDPPTSPRAMNIYLDHNGKEVIFPVTVLNIHDKWYVFEILLSSGRFD